MNLNTSERMGMDWIGMEGTGEDGSGMALLKKTADA